MRLVDNKLSTADWMVLQYLKNNCVGKGNARKGKTIAVHLDIHPAALRTSIAAIRTHQNVVIGADTKKGYYIPLESEYKEAVKYRQNKVLSEVERAAKADENFLLQLYSLLNKVAKTADYAVQNQIVIKFNGWEKDINKFGNKYKEGLV